MHTRYDDSAKLERTLGTGFTELKQLFAQDPLGPLTPIVEKRLFSDISVLCDALDGYAERTFCELLDEFGIRYECGVEDLQRIPEHGSLVIVANHPFGLAEGVILGAMLGKIRNDFRFLANHIVAAIPQLRRYTIGVNPYGSTNAIRGNRGAIREAVDWLKQGGVLVVFPAGDVSSLKLAPFGVTDCEWAQTAVRLARRADAPMLPMFFHGTNSPAFHAAAMLHPRLKTMLLPSEFLNKQGATIPVSVGSLIRPARLATLSGEEGTTYVRARTLILEARGHRQKQRMPLPQLFTRGAQIAQQRDPSGFAAELAALPMEQRLVSTNDQEVWIAGARQIPTILHEIGRLREVTFRAAGEGTHRALDLDRFDQHYEHLFLWNKDKGEIAGAYRLGRTDKILARHGIGGLYTSTLFHLNRDFYSSIGPALELGRSFIRPEWQKSYMPLLLLWKGLGQYVANQPCYRRLFGPVSISDTYTPASRALMVSFLRSRHGNPGLSSKVRPRKKFQLREFLSCHPETFSTLIENINELSELISDLEPDRKGIPILVQQYLNLGGEMLDFSVDAKFSNALDGLVVVDLTKTNRKQLERYLGKQGAQRYLEFHGMTAAA